LFRGPTGVEFAAELHDFVTEDMVRLYPDLADKVTMTVYDVASKILSSFDESLSEYAMNLFQRRGIKLKLQTKVAEVTKDHILLGDGTRVPYGMLVWSTGLTANPLIKTSTFDNILKTNNHTLQTDEYLRVLQKDGSVLEGVYALGDCSSMKSQPLPATAQVATQEAVYLANLFNKHSRYPEKEVSSLIKPFNFFDRGSMAYVGKWSAVVDLKSAKTSNSGRSAWLFWRSAYFTMTVSTKNKILIPMFWFLTWIFGRDISRI
jgi:NADH dehydrogenase FAD-containing subunit